MDKLLLKSAAPASYSMKPLKLKLNNRLFVPALPLNVEGRKGKNGRSFVCASKQPDDTNPSPSANLFTFEEVKEELMLMPTAPGVSLARREYADQCEDAVNEQIHVENSVSYLYQAMYAYFDRDNVALKGLAKFFKDSCEEEREHAKKLMEYQNKRGGKVKLGTLLMPLSEFDHAEKGHALYAMEVALALEKLTFKKLLNLHAVASQNNDAQLTDFIESAYLAEQVESVKKISEFVAQLRMVDKGQGVWHFDQMLLHQYGEDVA